MIPMIENLVASSLVSLNALSPVEVAMAVGAVVYAAGGLWILRLLALTISARRETQARERSYDKAA